MFIWHLWHDLSQTLERVLKNEFTTPYQTSGHTPLHHLIVWSDTISPAGVYGSTKYGILGTIRISNGTILVSYG